MRQSHCSDQAAKEHYALVGEVHIKQSHAQNQI